MRLDAFVVPRAHRDATAWRALETSCWVSPKRASPQEANPAAFLGVWLATWPARRKSCKILRFCRYRAPEHTDHEDGGGGFPLTAGHDDD